MHRREPPQRLLRRGPPLPPQILSRGRSWCCPLAGLPASPEITITLPHRYHLRRSKQPEKTEMRSKAASSFPNSLQSHKPGLVDRIVSPGRVSPIESFQVSSVALPSPQRFSDRGYQPDETSNLQEEDAASKSSKSGNLGNLFDVRLSLKGKNGDSLVLEVSSGVLSSNSSVFANLIADCRNNPSSCLPGKLCRIEVPDVENLNLFRETVELMFEDDITRRLLKIGVHGSIDILEVSAGIVFNKGVLSCLKYLEAVPWSEEEAEKLRTLFTKFNFSDELSGDILDRLYSLESAEAQQTLARHLVSSITSCVDESVRHELKPLIKGLLCKSSVYEKAFPDLSKEDIIAACQSSLISLVCLFEEACGTSPCGNMTKKETEMPLIRCISMQVDNINWLLELLLARQIAEDFVDMWTDQTELICLHVSASPMIRYELSRVSAMLFIAIGTKQLQCKSEKRQQLIQAWFRPMLLDFGWLRRCRKGLDMKVLQDAMGQAILTLPLKQQYIFLMEWFKFFSKHGNESPNLTRAFQIWWRRSFPSGFEPCVIEAG